MLEPGSFGDVLMVGMFSQLFNVPLTFVRRDEYEELPAIDGFGGYLQHRTHPEWRIRHDFGVFEFVGGDPARPCVPVVLSFAGNGTHFDALGECSCYTFEGTSGVGGHHGDCVCSLVVVLRVH